MAFYSGTIMDLRTYNSRGELSYLFDYREEVTLKLYYYVTRTNGLSAWLTWHAKAFAYDDLGVLLDSDGAYFTMAPWTATDTEPANLWYNPITLKFRMPAKNFIGKVDLWAGGSPDEKLASWNFLAMVKEVPELPQVGGRIIDKWIQRDSLKLSIPGAVQLNDSVELHVRGTISGIPVRAGMQMTVWRPDGSQLAPAVDWAGQNTGETLEWAINIKANQVGVWQGRIIYIGDSTSLDRWEGNLLVVSKVVVEPPPIPPEVPEVPEVPPEVAKFPWVPALLIGGGVALVVASAKPKKKKI